MSSGQDSYLISTFTFPNLMGQNTDGVFMNHFNHADEVSTLEENRTTEKKEIGVLVDHLEQIFWIICTTVFIFLDCQGTEREKDLV